MNFVKIVYRRIPKQVRGFQVVRRIQTALQGWLPHDWVYDADYYSEAARKPSLDSAPIIAATIYRDLRPKRVIDVGCGTGDLIANLREHGCEVSGLERSSAALEVCRSRNLPVRQFDLEKDVLDGDPRYDLVVSMEVAEHLPGRVADRYVQTLTSLGDTIVFTAASPGQGGTDHVNEQPAEYWIAKFKQHNFSLDADQTRSWSEQWMRGGKVASWYYSNLMVFTRDSVG